MKLNKLNEALKGKVTVGCIAEDVRASERKNPNRFCKVAEIKNGDGYYEGTIQCWGIWFNTLKEAKQDKRKPSDDMWCELKNMKRVW
jgi:hypothetical protein